MPQVWPKVKQQQTTLNRTPNSFQLSCNSLRFQVFDTYFPITGGWYKIWGDLSQRRASLPPGLPLGMQKTELAFWAGRIPTSSSCVYGESLWAGTPGTHRTGSPQLKCSEHAFHSRAPASCKLSSGLPHGGRKCCWNRCCLLLFLFWGTAASLKHPKYNISFCCLKRLITMPYRCTYKYSLCTYKDITYQKCKPLPPCGVWTPQAV